MRKLLGLLVIVAFLAAASTAAAGTNWPDKGWHRGPYLTANVGMTQATNDKHTITDRNFDGSLLPSFGLTFGWDVADWIGPLLQMNYATIGGQAGDPNNNIVRTYQGFDFPANTFPVQQAREHVINFGLYCRATLPYFTKAAWQGKNLKIIPYIKIGGLGHGLYVNAPTVNNKIVAFGGGLGFGGGAELFIWKGFMFALDITENVIFQQSLHKNINDVDGIPRRLTILRGGTELQFNLQGLFGYHF